MKRTKREIFMVVVPGDEDVLYFALESKAVEYAEQLEAIYPGIHVYVCTPTYEHNTAEEV